MVAFPRAFVSHAHEDKPVALELAGALRAAGVDAWIDAWEIAAGDSLVDKIYEHGLKDCDVFIVLLSPASLASRWVKDERLRMVLTFQSLLAEGAFAVRGATLALRVERTERPPSQQYGKVSRVLTPDRTLLWKG